MRRRCTNAAGAYRAIARRATLWAPLAALLCPAAYAAVTNCTVTAAGVAFGTYMPLAPTALLGTGTIVVVCQVNSHRNTITVALSPGTSGSFTTRTMTTTIGTTAYPLNYNLYMNAANTTIWGDGTGGSLLDNVTLTRTGGNNTITTNLTVYGAVAAAQDPAAGTYTDSITVTVNY